MAASEFKFRWHDENSARSGGRNSTGSFDGSLLRFGDLEVKLASIISVHVDGDMFMLGAMDEDGEFESYTVEIFGADNEELERQINAGRSQAAAVREKERLIDEGKLDSYQDAVCPFCGSTILLLDLPHTPQVYCEYCDTLFSRDREAFGDIEKHFRLCPSCEMYSRPRDFAVFYFYFLVFTFGFHHNQTRRCSACMRRSAWKMVVGNLFGLFGLPFAMIQLRRAYSTKQLTGVFEGLDAANGLALRGRIEQALEEYDLVMDNVPENAGIKFNVATGLMLKGDFEHAETMLELSLDDCANYWPAINELLLCLERQGKTKELFAVKKLWGLEHYQPE